MFHASLPTVSLPPHHTNTPTRRVLMQHWFRSVHTRNALTALTNPSAAFVIATHSGKNPRTLRSLSVSLLPPISVSLLRLLSLFQALIAGWFTLRLRILVVTWQEWEW